LSIRNGAGGDGLASQVVINGYEAGDVTKQ
jgi:hypothetical protein